MVFQLLIHGTEQRVIQKSDIFARPLNILQMGSFLVWIITKAKETGVGSATFYKTNDLGPSYSLVYLYRMFSACSHSQHVLF